MYWNSKFHVCSTWRYSYIVVYHIIVSVVIWSTSTDLSVSKSCRFQRQLQRWLNSQIIEITPVPADTYSRITREIHVFSVSKWCIFFGNTPCISRVIHEYQPKLHVLHEKSLHRNGAMMEKSRIIAKFLIHNYPTWTLTTRGAIWCIWCNARGNGVLGVEEVYVE